MVYMAQSYRKDIKIMENTLWILPGFISYVIYKTYTPGKEKLNLSRDLPKLLIISIICYGFGMILLMKEFNLTLDSKIAEILDIDFTSMKLNKLLIILLHSIIYTNLVVLIFERVVLRLLIPGNAHEDSIYYVFHRRHMTEVRYPKGIKHIYNFLQWVRIKSKKLFPLKYHKPIIIYKNKEIIYKGCPIAQHNDDPSMFIAGTKDFDELVNKEGYVVVKTYHNIKEDLKIEVYGKQIIQKNNSKTENESEEESKDVKN